MYFFKILPAMFTGLNLVFTVIMLIVFAISILQLFRRGQSNFVKQSPALLTSIGIFGTFFGIVIALLGFEGVDNIKEQIDVIISGMQTAFITSVLGLFLSIILKFIMIFQTTDENTDDITGNDLIEAFITQTNNSTEMVEKMNLLLNAIGRDGDNSMIGQIRLLRSDLHDNQQKNQAFFDGLTQKINQQIEASNKSFQVLLKSYQDRKVFEDKLWHEMNIVTQTLAKSATEAIIEALKDVISDFNNNLTEQFGENFKELNRAVFELVTWQENYKQQIHDMTQQYQLGVQAIDNTKTAIISIENSAQAIPNLIGQLDDVIDDNQNKLNELTKHLQTFADIRDKAVQSLPEIQKHIQLVLDNMQTGSKNIENVMTSTANTFKDNTQQSLNNINTLSNTILTRTQEIDTLLGRIIQDVEKGVQGWVQSFEQALQKLQQEFQNNLHNLTREQQEFFKTHMRDLTTNVQKTHQEMQDDINKILKDTQENMGKAQEKALSDMGKSLVSITGQFATDYEKLTRAMGEVVRQNGGFR